MKICHRFKMSLGEKWTTGLRTNYLTGMIIHLDKDDSQHV